jgi:hypothetical protein
MTRPAPIGTRPGAEVTGPSLGRLGSVARRNRSLTVAAEVTGLGRGRDERTF